MGLPACCEQVLGFKGEEEELRASVSAAPAVGPGSYASPRAPNSTVDSTPSFARCRRCQRGQCGVAVRLRVVFWC